MGAARRITLLIAGAAIVVVGATAVLKFKRPQGRESSGPPTNPWNAAAIKGSFVRVQVREIDAKSAAIVFLYDLENGTDSDYRLDNGPNVAILERLKSDSSLSSEKQIRLKEAAFVPAKNRTRIALETVEPFRWPDRTDDAAGSKFRDLAAQEVANLEGFVLFDEATRYEIELPGAWGELSQVATSTSER